MQVAVNRLGQALAAARIAAHRALQQPGQFGSEGNRRHLWFGAA
jgi:hypothetical protein